MEDLFYAILAVGYLSLGPAMVWLAFRWAYR